MNSDVDDIRVHVSEPCINPRAHDFVKQVFDSNQFSQGAVVSRFERVLAQYLDVRHVVAVTSGTAALHLALAALGIGPGDEVIVPDITFVATANAVLMCGATPVLCDVSGVSWGINRELAHSKLSKRTRAIIPVHLYGNYTSGARICPFRDDIAVVEDAAEAFGAKQNDQYLGTLGDCGIFSFYANKIITTGGEGGAVVTNNDDLAARLRHLRGQAMLLTARYFHTELGFNYRMTEIQAAIGLSQMDDVDNLLSRRRAVIEHYWHRLRPHIGVFSGDYCTCPSVGRAAPWLFTFLVPNGCSRNQLAHTLAAYGIETRPVFVPLHRLPHLAVDPLSHDVDHFPNASYIADHGISLPTHPNLTPEVIDHICNIVVAELDRQLNTKANEVAVNVNA